MLAHLHQQRFATSFVFTRFLQDCEGFSMARKHSTLCLVERWELSEAIVKEAPRRRWKPRASHRGDFVASYGRLRIRAWRAEKKVNELQDRLTKLTDSKTVGGRVSEEWITRVILAAPHVSGHALAETFHLAIGSDSNVISRDSIGAIRSAFLEMWKNLMMSVPGEREVIGPQKKSRRNTCVEAL